MLNKSTSLLLRLSVAFAFLWPSISAHIRPEAWVGYFPGFIWNMGLSESAVLWGFTIFHLIIVIWLLSGKYVFIPSAIAVIFLLSVVLMNLSQIDVIFRDISLALVALALALQSYPFRIPSILEKTK